MTYLYHASPKSGIKLFVPKKYWHISYNRSGTVVDDGCIPEGAEIINCFYAATKNEVPIFFLQRETRRLFVWRHRNVDKFGLLAELFGDIKSDNIIILDRKDRTAIETYEFSIYLFDASHFHRLPTDEFVSYEPVQPLKEIRKKNGLRQLIDSGYQVEFVDDLLRIMKEIKELGVAERITS